ncbi:MAG: hypothetical protein A2600_14085 [Candidatus Lambdaproteobacteria bacterium RIFOXYD1_FULL_56_27]|uniref:Uncharacterized protein n=1 Tax=Candidatus Lambdaproteobacteria bacterium RIFOXYD2_FULL_56_26 TaxID=1817773 RepID=A0A1F6H1C0_9PROT|nr:MAG: hypothetical protein A2557_14120 [Candidatus Lambdaproteobacteria bacterium RIFOXYD2_FULL_56_26]OGH08266.1 MAG: hypothetical protein A2600_14085 [Candidatus Lambdaproteobacteria bacterium RIFOXYD1_FULL_56_27]
MSSTKTLSLRVNEAQFEQITGKAKKLGFTQVSQYLKAVVETDLGQEEAPGVPGELLPVVQKAKSLQSAQFSEELGEDLIQGLLQLSQKMDQLGLKVDGYLGRTFSTTRVYSNYERLEGAITALAFYKDNPQELHKYFRALFEDVASKGF